MSDATAPAQQAPPAPGIPPLGGPAVRSADEPSQGDVHQDGPDAAPKKRKKGRMAKARAALATLLTHLAAEPASYSGSFQDLICAVQSALEARFGYGNTWEDYPSQVATTADSVVYNRGGDTWKLSYTIGPDGDPVLGDTPVKVKSQYVPISSTESARLFAEAADSLRFTEAPEWIPFLPIPGDYKHPVWGTLSMTEERNQRFVDNFKAGVYQSKLPVDAEHQTKLSGALGWITDMRLNEDGSVDAKVEWTDRGTSLVEADRFKYVSPEWYEEWQDPATEKVYSDVAIGAAVTTRPFFKEGSLRPLVASGDGTQGPPEPINQPPTPGENKNMADQNTPAAATEDVSRQMSELREQNAKLEADLAATRTAAEGHQAASEAASKALSEAVARIDALEASAQRKRFAEVASKWVGDREKHVDLLVQMSKSFGEDSEAFKHFVSTQDATAAQIRQAGLFTEIGSAGEASGTQSAQSQLEAIAAKIREAKPALTKEQAFSEACVANGELVKQMREEGR